MAGTIEERQESSHSGSSRQNIGVWKGQVQNLKNLAKSLAKAKTQNILGSLEKDSVKVERVVFC